MLNLIGLQGVNPAFEFMRSWVSKAKDFAITVGKKGAFQVIQAEGVTGEEITGPDTDADLYGIFGHEKYGYTTGGEGGLWHKGIDKDWQRCSIDGMVGYRKDVVIGDIACNDEGEWYAVDQKSGYYYSADGISWKSLGKNDKKAINLQGLWYSHHFECFVVVKAMHLFRIDKNGTLKGFHRNAAAVAAGHIIRGVDVSDEAGQGSAYVTRTIEVTGPEFDTWKFLELPLHVKQSGAQFQANLHSVTGIMPDGYRYTCGEDGVVMKFKVVDGEISYNNLTWVTKPAGFTLPARGTMTGIMSLKGKDGKYRIYISGASIKAKDNVLYSVVYFEI